MDSPAEKSVFFDTTQKRDRYYRFVTRFLSLFIVVSFGYTLWSIFQETLVLPAITPENVSLVRSVANVPSLVETPTAKTLLTPEAVLRQKIALQEKALGNPADIRAPRNLSFFVNWDDNSFSSLKANINTLDGLVPEWLHLVNADGTVIPDDTDQQNKVLDYVHSTRLDLSITPIINNYSPDKQDWDTEAIGGMLADPTARGKTIASISDFIDQNHLQGVSIDFENIPEKSQPDLLIFMKELYAALHPKGLTVTQNIPLEDPAFSAKLYAPYVDQLILMAYDEHAIGSETAGSIASQDWYERALQERLTEIPANKYIIAIGGYGYDWKDGGQDGEEISFQDSMRLSRDSGDPVVFDQKTLNPTFNYQAPDGTTHHVWYLDAVTAFNQMNFADTYHPEGYVLWRMGAEDPRVWSVFEHNKTHLDQSTANGMRIMPYGYDLDYEGDGEILRVTGTPRLGASDLAFDPATGRITDATITTYPSGYVITRYGGGVSNTKKIALTFDDGPDITYTPAILDILERYHVPGTFFIVGVNASQNPSIVDRIYQDGSDIGNHTFTHPNISVITPSQLDVELDSSQRLLESILGRNTLLFRPPYAEDIEPSTPEQIAPLLTTSQLGYYTVSMHIDPNDWDQPGTTAATIAQRVIDGATNDDGNIVLLHDGGGNRTQTALALPGIIETLQAQGYQLVTVSQLMGVPRDAVLPTVSGTDRSALFLNTVSWRFIHGFGAFLRFFFFAGIWIGIARLIVIIILALWQRFRPRHFADQTPPHVSVIVPAYNEAKVVNQTIESILASDYPNFDIIFVDDGSTDDTVDVVKGRFGGHPLVTVLSKGNGGKSRALNYGIERTDAPIVITLDADTQFYPDTLPKLVRHFSDPHVGAVAGNAKVGNRINVMTRWQALEYITSQNLDRRAFELMNAITVVPGAVGAWRREAVLVAGGFATNTLAEDADLTFAVVGQGYAIAYEDEAIGLTEAPDTVRNFIKQRYRWMYGTLQTIWKHRRNFFRVRSTRGLSLVALPNVLVFQVLFPLVSPLIDLALITSLVWTAIQRIQHPIDYAGSFQHLLVFYILFTVIDIIVASIAFLIEKRREEWSLILWLPLQRFFYRQLMYYIAYKAVTTVIKGKLVQWGYQERKATVVLKK